MSEPESKSELVEVSDKGCSLEAGVFACRISWGGGDVSESARSIGSNSSAEVGEEELS